MRRISMAVSAVIVLAAAFAAAAAEESPAPLRKIEVRADETVFTTSAYLAIGLFERPDPRAMPPIKRFVWERLDRTLSPAAKRRIRRELGPLRGRMLEYDATMLALNCTPPPLIRLLKREVEASLGPDGIARGEMDQILRLEALPARLTRFYREAGIADLFRDCRPWYDDAVASLRTVVSTRVAGALRFLRLDEADILPSVDRVMIIPDLIGPRGSAMGPTWRRIKFDVETPWDAVRYSAHEFIHDMISPPAKSAGHRDAVVAIARAAMARAAGTPGVAAYPDAVDYFEECLVRAVDETVSSSGSKPGSAAATDRASAIEDQVRRGFTLLPSMMDSLKDYAKSGRTFREFFPEMLRSLSGRGASG